MKIRIIYISLFAIVLSLFSSCRNEDINIYNANGNTAKNNVEIFDRFWTGMNENYAFWDVDPTDWDEVYRKYKPKFEGLDENYSDEEYVRLFTEMTANIIDHHYAIKLNVKEKPIIISPSEEQ